MAKCSRCGRDIGTATVCPSCGYGPSQGVFETSASRVANVTGRALAKGVDVTEKVVKEATPVVREAVSLGKKGVKKVKDETVKVAKKLQDQ